MYTKNKNKNGTRNKSNPYKKLMAALLNSNIMFETNPHKNFRNMSI